MTRHSVSHLTTSQLPRSWRRTESFRQRQGHSSRRSPEEGLLLIYPISGASKPGRNAKNRMALFDEGETARSSTRLRGLLPVFFLARHGAVCPGPAVGAAMNPAELEEAWGELPTPDQAQQLQAVALQGNAAWAAVDQLGRRHLLLEVPPGTEAPPTTTRGLTMTVARHQVHGAAPADYLDLLCQAEDAVPTFTAVAADIGAEVATAPLEQRVATVLYALRRWRWFWGIDADQLSMQDALGLFGELWFLDRWATATADNVTAWTASSGARHDFQWPSLSVEVKTATRRADGAVLHRIQHLDQLADPESGQLFLFSLRVVRDELARNTLVELADRLTTRLAGDAAAADLFAKKLGQRGTARRIEIAMPPLTGCLVSTSTVWQTTSRVSPNQLRRRSACRRHRRVVPD